MFHAEQSVTKHEQIVFSFAFLRRYVFALLCFRETISASCNLYFPAGLSYICDIFPMHGYIHSQIRCQLPFRYFVYLTFYAFDTFLWCGPLVGSNIHILTLDGLERFAFSVTRYSVVTFHVVTFCRLHSGFP